MPNHITNKLTVTGPEERVEQFFSDIKGEKEDFDFNRLIPMPEELKGTTSPQRPRAGESQQDFELRMAELRSKYGAVDWYEWANTYWGTKWGAYKVTRAGNVITFDTAWATPIQIWEHIINKYPDLSFHIKWADEDLGYNTGEILFEDGELVLDEHYEGRSVKAWETVFELNPYASKYYAWNEDHTAVIDIEEEDDNE